MKAITLMLIPSLLFGDPWGKDSGLAYPQQERIPINRTVGDYLIEFHRSVISPADGPRSNFVPTSSVYTLDAMHKYGFFTGVMMGCDRLMRENKDPWVYRKIFNSKGDVMKWDPVE